MQSNKEVICMDKGCDGCCTGIEFPDCVYTEVEGCPCKICLVKMMCHEPCEYLLTHVKRVERGNLQ